MWDDWGGRSIVRERLGASAAVPWQTRERSSASACPGLFEGKDLGGTALPGDIRDIQRVPHPFAWNPAVHPGDVFEDLAVQRRPIHAEDVNQHKPPVGGSADVGLVQVAPAPPGRRLLVPRIDHLRCPPYLPELRITAAVRHCSATCSATAWSTGAANSRKTTEPPPSRSAASSILGSHRLPAHLRHR